MRIQYASDLHLEFRDNTDYLSLHPLNVVGDILVLAGDITLFGTNKQYKHPFFDWCADNYEHTFIVPGNHEYYKGVELTNYQDDFELTVRPNVSYINNRSKIIDDVEIFFTTLWSKISPMEIVPVQLGMADCHRIKYKGKAFSANDYETLYNDSLKWLSEALSLSNAQKKVIVTHHCPSTKFADPRFVGSTINSAFCVDLDRFIENSGIDYWIYGHTHFNGGNGSTIDRTVMLCNQLGYVKHGEHDTFKHDLFIDL